MKPKNILKAITLGSALTIASSTVAMAAIPSESTIIIGTKAYHTDLLFSNAYTQQINSDLAVANGILYYNLGDAGWKDIMSNEVVTNAQMAALPQVTYLNKDGSPTTYKAGNGDAVEADTTAPVITLTGDETVTVVNGADYTDEGAIATDDVDATVEVTSVITDAEGNEVDAIDTTVAGVYTYTYSAKDAAGNEATAVTRTVTVEAEVIADTTAPVITLTGNATETVANGATYTDAGATATDDVDATVAVTSVIKDATGAVVTTIDTTVAGVYTYTYSAKDVAGNEATAVTRTVTVEAAVVVLNVDSVIAIDGTVTVTLKSVATEVPADLVILKDGVAMTLTADKFAVADGKVVVTVPAVAATAVEQSVVYSAKLGDGSAVAASAVVVAADAELAAQAAAETAVAAYQGATITTYADIATTSTLKTAANTAVAAVTDPTAKAAFTTRVSAKQVAITTQLTGVVAAVNAAGANQAQLLAALKPFFLNVNDASLAAYDVPLDGTQTLVAQIQSAVDAVNDTAAVNAATNQITLLAALQAGVQHGTFVNVRDNLIVQYDVAINAIQTTVQIQAAITAQNLAADAAAAGAVAAAQGLVVISEAGPTAANIATAQAAVTALPADVAPATTKADLNARLAAIAPVAPVLAAVALNDTMLLNTALQSSVYTQVNTALMLNYIGTIVPADRTVALIQARIDAANTAAANANAAANVAAANASIGLAEAPTLTAAKVATAQALVTALPADVAPATTKAVFQTRLDVVNALLAVDTAVTAGDASDASVLAALQANATVLGITDLNAPYASFYRPALAGAQTVRDTAAEVRILITGVNAARVPVATAAVVAAEAPTLTAANVAAAQLLVTALPADIAPATTKAALQTRLDVVNALLSVDGAVVAAGATDASVLAVLQANATVLGITDLNAPYASFYRPALAGAQTVRDTVAEVRALITGVNAARVPVATAAVVAAETGPLTAVNVAAAQLLVTALPADIAPATTKAALQTRLDVVNSLLSVDGAVVAVGATDATVLAALQANATVLGLTGPSAVNPSLATAYRAALAGAQTVRDTAGEVQAIITVANSPIGALAALANNATNGSAAAVLVKLQDLTLNLTGVVVANQAAYFADVTALETAAGVNVASVQRVVNAVNALVLVNSASTAAAENTALTSVALNTANAASTTYVNLNSTGKLEVATLVLANRPAVGGYANIAAIHAAITAQDAARTAFLGGVNAATDNATMIAALNVAQLPAFMALGVDQQLDKAELVLNALNALPPVPPAVAPAHGSFTTITAIMQVAGL